MIRVIQTCERCRKSREIKDRTDRSLSGWREIESGVVKRTLCAQCLADVIEWIDATAQEPPDVG